jgi:hypothetical protein
MPARDFDRYCSKSIDNGIVVKLRKKKHLTRQGGVHTNRLGDLIGPQFMTMSAVVRTCMTGWVAVCFFFGKGGNLPVVCTHF